MVRKDEPNIEYDQDTIMNIAMNESIRGGRGFIVKVLDSPQRL